MLNAKIIKEISSKIHPNIGYNDSLPFTKQILTALIVVAGVFILVLLFN